MGFSFITHYTKNSIPNNKFFNYYRSFIWIIFQCETSLALLVDITVWFILVPFSGQNPANFLDISSISMHILNAVFLFTDLFLNDLPIHFHFGFFALIPPLIYTMFAWLYYDLVSKWDYFFMDSTKAIDSVWLVVVWTMHFLSWTVVWKMGQCKKSYHKIKKQRSLSINDTKNAEEVGYVNLS